VTSQYLGIANDFPTAPRDGFLVANADYVAQSTGSDAVGSFLVNTGCRDHVEKTELLRNATTSCHTRAAPSTRSRPILRGPIFVHRSLSFEDGVYGVPRVRARRTARRGYRSLTSRLYGCERLPFTIGRMRSVRTCRHAALLSAALVALAACASGTSRAVVSRTATSTTSAPTTTSPSLTPSTKRSHTTRGIAVNIYAADRPSHLSAAVAGDRRLIYVPNSLSDTVDVIDPSTFRIVEHFAVGHLPQHVVPSYDLRTLYVTNDLGNSLTPIDPRTGAPGTPIPVDDPYNLYFTPNGKRAIVVAERRRRLDFRDAATMQHEHQVPVPCAGVDHLDFSADGAYLIASCEYSGTLVKVDVAHETVLGELQLTGNAKPQDVRLSPDGRVFYVADMDRAGVYTVDGDALRVTGFVPTGAGAHGLYPSRDARVMYVSNRGAGTISLLSFATNRITATWRIPGGSPDMGGVSADGKTLWLSGRYNAEVYAIDTATGALRARIHVGSGPHGLCVFPQPGNYSLGHTGIFR
jgi:DNA-binding beta-propeller fold protein YncE